VVMWGYNMLLTKAGWPVDQGCLFHCVAPRFEKRSLQTRPTTGRARSRNMFWRDLP
jgi:hypothetical protein